MTNTAFSSLPLQAELLQNLGSLGYTAMTEIQAQSLPLILRGEDVIAQAKTGSGKTAAFGLGILTALEVKKFAIQALVLCPTRELADQVAKELRKLARAIHNIKILSLCGGMPLGPQIGSLEHGAHIVVGTPGRIEEHLRKGTLVLSAVKCFVLDEGDRMLEMGFQPSLDAIAAKLPTPRQTLLFSATYPPEIESLASRLMKNPRRVQVESQHDNLSIAQHFFALESNEQRTLALRLLLLKYRPQSAVVFCNTRREVDEVASALREDGFSALALHGDLEQRQRDQTLVRFAGNSVSILVASDVAARGLDIDALDAVFNYHIARDAEVHVHRIGRTGRAGSQGRAFSFYTGREQHKMARLAAMLERDIQPEPLPPMSVLDQPRYQPAMATLQIDGGRKAKLRPGDIVGALTANTDISAGDIGKIALFDTCAYVSVRRDIAADALSTIGQQKMKGRSFRVRRIRG